MPEPTLQFLRAAQASDTAEVSGLERPLSAAMGALQETEQPAGMYAAAILSLCRAKLPRPILSLPPAAYPRVVAALERPDADGQ